MKVISIKTNKRNELLDITDEIRKIVKESGLKEGICVLFCPHTTAGLTINENADPSVRMDIVEHISSMVPENKIYKHVEGNADSHIKSVLVGQSLNLIINEGDIVLGTWQGIFFCEFDGPRIRKVFVKIIGG